MMIEGMEGWKAIIEATEIVLDIHKSKATYIKEKFGSLRIYTDKSSPEIHTAILMAEYVSAITCQKCGCYSKIKSRKGWYTTTCDKCI